jgi:predicted GNAT family N-acyltransferase
MKTELYSVRLVNWVESKEPLQHIRIEVFVKEQAVPIEEEWDGLDDDALHLLAVGPTGEPIGTNRLLIHEKTGHIGRMAVMKSWRGKGVGLALMQTMLEIARKQGLKDLFLNAQTYAIPFYEKVGFKAVGDEFDEAGMPHYRMELTL